MATTTRKTVADPRRACQHGLSVRVVAMLIIDGGDVGKVEASFLVDRRIMTRLTDLLDNIREDQLRTG